MNVSIIMPLHNPEEKIITQIEDIIKKQKFSGKIEIIKVNKGLGLSESLNLGIKKAKHEIVISLHQDCIPQSNEWLKNLVKPFEEENIVASVSKVELPYDLWNKFDFVGKILSVKEQDIITPLMDEKGCAYRRSVLIKTGLFDEKRFRTAGEDFDMYLKLKKLGEVTYPNAIVTHSHKHSWKNRFKKELQLSNGFGALVRIYGNKMPKYYVGLIKALPLVGYPLFFYRLDIKKLGLISIISIPLYLFVNILYSYGFWKGFLTGREEI